MIVSAGFDAHRDDPVGSLGLETEDFGPLTTAVLDVADAYAGGKLVSVLEGGYNTGILAGCVALHLQTLLDRDSSGRRGAPDHFVSKAAGQSRRSARASRAGYAVRAANSQTTVRNARSADSGAAGSARTLFDD